MFEQFDGTFAILRRLELSTITVFPITQLSLIICSLQIIGLLHCTVDAATRCSHDCRVACLLQRKTTLERH